MLSGLPVSLGCSAFLCVLVWFPPAASPEGYLCPTPTTRVGDGEVLEVLVNKAPSHWVVGSWGGGRLDKYPSCQVSGDYLLAVYTACLVMCFVLTALPPLCHIPSPQPMHPEGTSNKQPGHEFLTQGLEIIYSHFLKVY